MGCLEILNVGAGDVKINFNPGDVAETIRAKRIIQDMLRRGFALVVEVERAGEKAYERVLEFDAASGEYIIADFDSSEAAKVDRATAAPEMSAQESPGEEPETAAQATIEPSDQPRKRGRPRARLPMETAKATGIGRSAGG